MFPMNPDKYCLERPSGLVPITNAVTFDTTTSLGRRWLTIVHQRKEEVEKILQPAAKPVTPVQNNNEETASPT